MLRRWMMLTCMAFELAGALLGAAAAAQKPDALPAMYYSDSSRLGRPYAKDPSVVKFKGAYWMYYSIPAPGPDAPAPKPGEQKATGWGIGIARSEDRVHWAKVGEVAPEQEIEKPGIAAPGARVIDNKVELFYQTYGFGRRDAICHATSVDGLHFIHDPGNPVYRPTQMTWSAGRAIDAEVYPVGRELLLFFATRDPAMKIQQIALAASPLGSGYGAGTWHDVSVGGPTLRPELAWEQTCIEAPALLRHRGLLYLFYAGAYNNAPQQIGVATSRDGRSWTRMSTTPLLANGAPGSWNASESGHPGVLTDDDGRTYLYFQGNNDQGKTWFLSMMEIRWHGRTPYLVAP